MLSASIKLLGLLCVLAFAILLALRFVLLPNVDNYKPQLEQMLSVSLGRTVTISQISASWDGLRPRLELKQLAVRDALEQDEVIPPLLFSNVQATVSWISVLFAELRLYNLEISQPEVEIIRNHDGKIFIAGWWMDPEKKGDVKGLNWILSQRSIVIKNGTLRWTDLQREAPVLTLSNVDFNLRNQWQHHRFSLSANPPKPLAGPLNVRADFKDSPFRNAINDFFQGKGHVYVGIPNTDLAAWKSYVTYPFEVQQGVGSVSLWLTFDKAKIVDVTADLQLSNVNAQLRPDLQPLDLKSLSGRISASVVASSAATVSTAANPNAPSNAESAAMAVLDHFLENGHQIALTNFSFESRSGMRLPPTTLSEKFIPASKNEDQQVQFSSQSLELATLAELAKQFPLSREYSELLNTLEPMGQLSNFSVKLEGKFPDFSRYHVRGGFTNLALQLQSQKESTMFSQLPGFANLTGFIDANEKKGSVQLSSKNLLLNVPHFLIEPELKFDRADMKANWSFQGSHVLLTVSKLDFTQKEMKGHFSGTHHFPMQAKSNQEFLNGTLDLTGSISNIDLANINHYLPSKVNPDLRHWLTQGLQQGRLIDTSIRIKGKLTDFPFNKKGLADQGIFNVAGKIVNGKINYLPGDFGKNGVTPYWPLLSKVEGHIVFDRASIDIRAESGETDGIPVAKVHARIPDLYSHNVMLEIVGTASGPAQDMLHYLSISPVLQWIDEFTLDTKMTGNAKLKLRLDIPLFHPLDTLVAGEVQLDGNDVALMKDLPLLTQVTGRLSFNERGLNLPGLKGSFLGSPVTVVGGTQKDGVIRIRADGQITADGIRKAYPQAALKNVLAKIDGKTSYTGIIQVKNKQTDVWVDSTMQGMALGLPAPFNKAASEQLPLRVERTSIPRVGSQRDTMKLSLGNVVHTQYLRQRESAADPWKVIRGAIGINAPASVPAASKESGQPINLVAQVVLSNLDVDEFQALFPDTKQQTSGQQENKQQENRAASTMDLYQYLFPNSLALQAKELVWMGKKLNQVVLGATYSKGIWQANIDSKQISGRLTWDSSEQALGSEQGHGRIKARLASLIIPHSAANDVVDLLNNENIHSTIPSLDVIADHVELFGKKLGRLELRAKNILTKGGGEAVNEWQIDALHITNPDAELTATGKWVNTHNVRNRTAGESKHAIQSRTDLNYQLALMSAGKLLDRLGYPNLFSGGRGKLAGQISWDGLPYSMDIPSLSGHVQLDLQAGQFLKVDPGAAKLLSVLNLQSLPRRLILDFRDVFSEGFSFDGITGDADVEKGIAKTDNLKMHSTSATVLLSGSANITNETQDLHVIVVPEVNAGAASVVYGLAVNPLIGAGTFLAQLFLREPLMKAFTFEYQVTGPWKEPNVVTLSDKKQDSGHRKTLKQ